MRSRLVNGVCPARAWVLGEAATLTPALSLKGDGEVGSRAHGGGGRRLGCIGTRFGFMATLGRRLMWSGTPRQARTGLSHLCSARSKGRTRLMTGNRIVVTAAPKGLALSTDGQTVAGEWRMSATEFRARCLGLIDEVAETGREIVITKRCRAVACLPTIQQDTGFTVPVSFAKSPDRG